MKYEKVSPSLLSAWMENEAAPAAVAPAPVILSEFAGGGAAPTLAVAMSAPSGVVAAVGPRKPARAIVFLTCDTKAKFKGKGYGDGGIVVNQGSGALRTAFLPLESLEALSAHSGVQRIQASHLLRPSLDRASTATRLPGFRTATGLTGKNVVIGIVDTGIDPSHPAFAGRILRIWDQTVSGPGVAEGPYGLEVAGASLTASRDFHGHGTHVAGIAAGKDATFGGVAPKARLVVVKTDFNDAHIADGVRYVFRVARSLGQPAVVNLSLGGHFDPHDGTDPLCARINAAVGAGRLVVAAAGNEGNDPIHARGVVQPATVATFRVQTAPAAVPIMSLNGWATAGATVEVAVQAPNGQVTPFQAPILAGNPVKQHVVGGASVRVATPGPDPINGDWHFTVDLRPASTAARLPAGMWTLHVRHKAGGTTTCDLWLLEHPDFGGGAALVGPLVSDDIKIGSPGAASGAVTVASTTTRNAWTDSSGVARSVGLPLNTISDFSSEGPLRNAARKPDVAAPGAMLASALSADATPSPEDVLDPLHQVMAGTSMATPFVTGLLALLLERTPTLAPAAALAALKAAAKIPGAAAGAFDRKWGHGLVDALGL